MWNLEKGYKTMIKKSSSIIVIVIFMITGGVIGYFVGQTQQNQLLDPEYIKFWTDSNMPVPEPISYTHAILGLLVLFGGIPRGIICWQYFLKKYMKPDRVTSPLTGLLSIMLFPIYTVIGVIICIPFVVIQVMVMIFEKAKRII